MDFKGHDIKFHIAHDCSVSFYAPFIDSEQIVEYDLAKNFRGPSLGSTWAIARAIVKSGIDWPDWEACHERIVGLYKAALGNDLQFRDMSFNSEMEKNQTSWDRFNLACSIYKIDYVPEYVRMPDFFEGPTARLSDFRRFADDIGMSFEALDDYYLKSWGSERLFPLNNSSYQDSSLNEMLDLSVVRVGKDIDRKVMINYLSFADLRLILKELKIKPKISLDKCKKQLVDELDSGSKALESLLLKQRDWRLFGEIIAIPGYDWDDFQSFRQQVKGAAEAMVDVYNGIVASDLSNLLKSRK